jgi:hypothetical protein
MRIEAKQKSERPRFDNVQTTPSNFDTAQELFS